MHQILPVKKSESIQDRAEHFAGFRGRKRTLGKNLGKNLVRILGDGKEQILAVKFRAAVIEKPDQMRMREGLVCFPLRDRGLGIRWIGRNEFDGGLALGFITDLGQEDAARLRSTQPAEKGESSIDEATDRIGAGEGLTHIGLYSNGDCRMGRNLNKQPAPDTGLKSAAGES